MVSLIEREEGVGLVSSPLTGCRKLRGHPSSELLKNSQPISPENPAYVRFRRYSLVVISFDHRGSHLTDFYPSCQYIRFRVHCGKPLLADTYFPIVGMFSIGKRPALLGLKRET